MSTVHTLQSPSALLRRTQLLPGESLVSLLERLTLLNYYASSHTLQQVCRSRLESPANQDDLRLPKWAETFLRLADLTCISPEELYAASDHRFAPFLTPPRQSPVEISWIDSTSKAMLTRDMARGRIRSASAAQYCPRCLKTDAYHRLNWILATAAICLEHRCLLLSQCPQCRKLISIQEIVRQRCRVCLADLSAAEPISVEGNELGIQSQLVIQSWPAVADATNLPGMRGLPSQNPAVLYHFLENLSRRLLNCGKDWPSLPAPLDGLTNHIVARTRQLQTLTPDGILHLQMAAFTGLTNWPDGLFEYLDAYSTPIHEPADRAKRLEQVRQNWFQSAWRIPEFEFVQRGLVNYLLTRNIPLPVSLAENFTKVAWFVEQTGLWSEEPTAQTLSISIQELHRFGSVVSCRWPRCRNSTPLFERDKVLALKQKWTRGWSVPEASSWLGLDEDDVIDLVKRGELLLVDNPDEGENHWVLSRRSVEGYFKKVVTRLELYQGDQRDLARLWEAIDATSDLGINAVTLLQGVVDGFLPAYKRGPEILSLGHTCFLKDAVCYLPDLCYARYGWVSGYAFAHEKGFFPRVVAGWVDAGLIKPQRAFGHYMYFVRQDLEELAAKFIPT